MLAWAEADKATIPATVKARIRFIFMEISWGRNRRVIRDYLWRSRGATTFV
jgi:hypothetical protein